MEPNRSLIKSKNFPQLGKAKTIVLKVGTSILIDPDTNLLKADWLKSFVQEITELKKYDKDIILVSSGAIALGKKILSLESQKLELDKIQASAAVGQIRLAQAYEMSLNSNGINSAQILLTSEDSHHRRRYLNIRSTIKSLLKMGVIPIVNENDTVATDEIKFGDNDRLAAQVALISEADLLILLSDIDGFYESDPNVDPNSKHLSVVNKVTPELLKMASSTKSENSKGGMITKLEAAKIAMNGGCEMIIANGSKHYPLNSFINGGDKYTKFIPENDHTTLRKQWILSIKPKGSVIIDNGAILALKDNKSLLPAGVVKSSGDFQRGDAVEIISHVSEKIGQGLSAYSSTEVSRIKGCQTFEIEEKLGYPGRIALVHRDDLVLS